MNLGVLVEVISVIVGVIAIYVTQKNFAQSVRTEQHKNSEQISNRITALEVKISVFWDALMASQIKILHHPSATFARRDLLLEKLLSGEISLNELSELQTMLKSAIGGLHDEAPGEAVAASILLSLIEARTPLATPELDS